MPEFKAVFEQYGGDYETTMPRFMGSREMYLRILNMLFQDENIRILGEALEKQDFSAAFDAAHTLKGVAGNLGLTPLYEAACQMAETLRNGRPGEDYPLLYQKIQEEFGKVEILYRDLLAGE